MAAVYGVDRVGDKLCVRFRIATEMLIGGNQNVRLYYAVIVKNYRADHSLFIHDLHT